MTRPDLDALAALLDKATPGPWTVDTLHWADRAHIDRALIVAAVNALPALIARVRELEQWQHDMVEKATAKSLDGYRELAARAAWKEEA